MIERFESGLSAGRHTWDEGTGEMVVSRERVVEALTSLDSGSTSMAD
jgi:hypothetical protein